MLDKLKDIEACKAPEPRPSQKDRPIAIIGDRNSRTWRRNPYGHDLRKT